MSGGSLDYVCYKVQEAAQTIALRDTRTVNPELWSAFAKHLHLIGEALHEVEWYLSNDSSLEKAEEAMRKCLTHYQILEAAFVDAESLTARADLLLANIRRIKQQLEERK